MAKKHNRKQTGLGYGNGSVRCRGPAQWEARFRVNGQEKTKTHDSEKAALDWLLSLGSTAGRPDRQQQVLLTREITLAQAMRSRLESKQLKSERDQHLATDRLIHDFGHLCGKALYDIDEIDIRDFINARLRQKASNSTVNRDLSIFSNTFNVARTRLGCTGLINPIGHGTRLSENRGRLRRLSHEEEAALLRQAAIYEIDSSVPIRTIIVIACESAMRFSETAGMQWEHVDLATGIVHLPETKNGTPRNVPLWPSVRELLRHLEPKSSGPVWPTKEAIRSAWRRVKTNAIEEAAQAGNKTLAQNLRTLRYHDLRHEGTSRLIERTGWSDAEIMAVTGHKTSAMLARYAHLRADRLAARMTALERGADGLRIVPKPVSADDTQLPARASQRLRWIAVSSHKDLLQMLVSTKSITDIANDFNVSDSAVHKACERLQITKQPRGHWLKHA